MIVAGGAVAVTFRNVPNRVADRGCCLPLRITVETGQFEVMKASVARLSADERLQAVLVAFCFGAFIKGAAPGFGTAGSRSATFWWIGVSTVGDALLCLIANTAPVAWGGIGTPILTLSRVTGLDVHSLSATAGRILPILSLVIPFWLVRVMTGWRETLAVWFPLLVIGETFAVGSILVVQLYRLRAGGYRVVGGQHRSRGDRRPLLASRADLAFSSADPSP